MQRSSRDLYHRRSVPISVYIQVSIFLCAPSSLSLMKLLTRLNRRGDLDRIASDFSAAAVKSIDMGEDHFKVYSAALKATANDVNTDIHPLQMAAAVIYDDGEIETAWQLKGYLYFLHQYCTDVKSGSNCCIFIPLFKIKTQPYSMCMSGIWLHLRSSQPIGRCHGKETNVWHMSDLSRR